MTTLILAGTHATGTAGHLRYFEWTDRYADAYMQLYGIPPHQMGDTSHPADYGIEWPRQIEIEVNETLRDVIVRAYFDHCVVGVSRAIPRRPPRPKPQRRIWGVFARIR